MQDKYNDNLKQNSSSLPLAGREECIGDDAKLNYKFCPRCASPGNFNDHELSFKCPVCGFYFFLNSAAAVTALIFNEKGELLVTKRGIEPSLGMIDLPGGFVDPGESVEDALFREIREELNLSPSFISYYGSFPNHYPFSGCIVNTVDMAFICIVDSFEGLKSMDDVSDVIFIKPEGLNQDLVAFNSAKNIINKLIDERHHCKTDK